MSLRPITLDLYQNCTGFLEAHRHDAEFLKPTERRVLLEIRNAYIARYQMTDDQITEARNTCRAISHRLGTPIHLPSGKQLA